MATYHTPPICVTSVGSVIACISLPNGRVTANSARSGATEAILSNEVDVG